MKTPADKRIVFTVYSHPMKDPKQRWKAQVTFEPGSTDDSPVGVSVNDGEGVPVAKARFEFAGNVIPIVDGKGSFRCGDFVKGKHEQAIWLYRRGSQPVPGALTFE